MATLQYRVYLFDPTVPRPERPVQAFFNHKTQADSWAEKYLRSAGEGSEVWIYKIEEVLDSIFGSYPRFIVRVHTKERPNKRQKGKHNAH